MTNADEGNHIAVITRLSALAELDKAAVVALRDACNRSILVKASYGVPEHLQTAPTLIVSGWAARARTLSTGQRQLVDLALPGEIVRPIDPAAHTLYALTDLRVVAAPDATLSTSLEQAYRRNYQLRESYLMAQTVRLGLFEAKERIVDFAVELLERSMLATDLDIEIFHMPLTQFHIGEALGITAVHVNRKVQLLRSESIIHFKRGAIRIPADSEIGTHVRRNIAALKSGDHFPQRMPFYP
jgi:CRP-like cAMP-binding protein